MQLAAVPYWRDRGCGCRAVFDRRHWPGMVTDDVPAAGQPHESVGRHEVAVGQYLAADHDGEAGAADHPFVGATHLGRFWMAQDSLPAAQDLRPVVQGPWPG